jgi:putative transcriptional regulator
MTILSKFIMEKNHILVATPNIIGDLYFRRTVVLLVNNSNKTTMGFMLNKKMNYTLNEITPKIIKPFPLFYGGPLETDSLFFIYSSKVKVKGAISISKDLNWGGDFNEIIELLKHDKISKDDIKFFMGYSGWSQDQLKIEIKENNWEIIEQIDKGVVLSNNTENIWKNFIKSIGEKYLIWSNSPENPGHN